ncbi:ABC transporter transmembrane domain-containing protein [Streptomyces sp. NBC_00079]|uniref:ABC transporter transmembrane domain-containing protein n=1 Tax=Streptomyces sp. NBC_00079 TaxID=2975644 RepID=UPI003249CB7C
MQPSWAPPPPCCPSSCATSWTGSRRAPPPLTPWTILLAGLGAIRFAAGFTRRYHSGRFSLGVQYDLRNDAFAALLRLGGAQQDSLRTGEVVSRSISDITLIQTLLQFLPNLTGNALMFLFSLVCMALLSPSLTVVALIVGPVLCLIALRSRRTLFPANWHASRRPLGVVPQEPHLFSGTVRDAIAYGRPEATDAEVGNRGPRRRCPRDGRRAAAGLPPARGGAGSRPSAGQRRLLALARAELVGPDILLLDEATASLDLATERRVAAATQALSGRRTTVVVAHRLTTAARADRVVVLDAGVVVESGTHAELLAARGPYHRLWQAFAQGGRPAITEPLKINELVKENAR